MLFGIRRARITREHGDRFLSSLNALGVGLRDPISYDRLISLAHDNGLTVYDAAYLDLALTEGLPLATLDDALRRSAARTGVPAFKLGQ